MALAILGIVGTVLPFVIWLIKRKATNADTPEAIATKHREEIARNLIKRDSVADAVRLNDLLRSLPGRTKRPGSSDAQGGPKADGPA